MSIALTEDHRALAETAAAFLARRDARGSARSLLEAPDEGLPSWWAELADLGWLGLHVPEELGGSGVTAGHERHDELLPERRPVMTNLTSVDLDDLPPAIQISKGVKGWLMGRSSARWRSGAPRPSS